MGERRATMNKKIKQLVNLMEENPNIPVIPMIDSEVVRSDDFAYWQGSFGDSAVKEFTFFEMYGDYPEMVYKDDTDGIKEYLLENDCCSTDAEAEKIIEELEWKRAIIVDIVLP